jgi:lysozyme family protein
MIDEIIRNVLIKEGGYVDDKDDAGGATNLGISLRYARGIGLDLDGDGDTDDVDIQLVTIEQAAALYKQDFYIHPRIWKLPEEIREFVFDCAVNHGPPRAVMFVQNILNQAGYGYLDIDGVIGPKTVKAADQAQGEMGPYLINALVEHRIKFYHQIVQNRPSQAKFLKGWVKRARSFLSEV